MYLKFIAYLILLANLQISALDRDSHIPSFPEVREHQLFVASKAPGERATQIDAIIIISVLDWNSSLVTVNDKLGLSSRRFTVAALPSVRTTGCVSNLCLTLTDEQARAAGLLS